MTTERVKIASFYKFLDLGPAGELQNLKASVRQTMSDLEILGTVILASEGVNSSVCGGEEAVDRFLAWLSSKLSADLEAKFSFSATVPFRKIDVKVKPEIVTLKKPVDISLGAGTHVKPAEWNELIADPQVVVLDTRNDYEFRTGTFERALNPATRKFSELPDFVKANLDPARHKKVAMFCTGGIRCEKFAPYMKSLGFENVFQLEGGILKYLEEVPAEEQRWRGECFVFDTRISVNEDLEPGTGVDLSQKA
ncbi:MAG TPA: rhodanese-like domain-containing protein [Pyrinomonadaceae bacterium]